LKKDHFPPLAFRRELISRGQGAVWGGGRKTHYWEIRTVGRNRIAQLTGKMHETGLKGRQSQKRRWDRIKLSNESRKGAKEAIEEEEWVRGEKRKSYEDDWWYEARRWRWAKLGTGGSK